MSSSRSGQEQQPTPRRLLRTQTTGNLGESIFNSEVVPSSLVEIAPILRVANEVEATNPRVAYLCFVVSLCFGSNTALLTDNLPAFWCIRIFGFHPRSRCFSFLFKTLPISMVCRLCMR
ncbi:hypothetical protein HPP92_027290 [Vanilla planifolia]|uniref:Uncharacterized protein n=1 Tax=Vanilla planifolia TaxID=51239 RepID=A0A835PBS6_VANPL|nr:hypothetical protein HPP92_027290 [Vanilla planifolia]